MQITTTSQIAVTVPITPTGLREAAEYIEGSGLAVHAAYYSVFTGLSITLTARPSEASHAEHEAAVAAH